MICKSLSGFGPTICCLLLESHRGKVVLVNFWATWCGPCIHEIPALINLREKLDPSRFALVAISLDDQADAAWLVPEFIETRFREWHSYLNGEFEDYLLVEELDPFWPGVMPANYVIGPDGSIVRTLLGGHSEEQFEEAVLAAMAGRLGHEHPGWEGVPPSRRAGRPPALVSRKAPGACA